jgi:hypothetical protein
MAGKKLRGQTAALTLEQTDGTEIVVGTLDNPFVSVPQEVQELRGTGDVKWIDLQKTEQAVTIGGDIATMELEAWDKLVGWDEATTTLGSDADVETFNIVITAEAADGSTKEIKAGPGYRNNDLELGGGREEWWGMTLELRCNDIISITNTDTQTA